MPAPLPLAKPEAVQQAVRLHRSGWTYEAIRLLMAEYHEQFYSYSWWREAVRTAEGRPRPRIRR